MIRLFIIAVVVLLSVTLASAQFLPTPMLLSGSITNVVGGGTVACDYGPNTTFPSGTVGTNLNTTNYTHCALNADFNTTSTDSNGIKWSDPTTWLSQCMGNPSSLPWRFYLRWTTGSAENIETGGDAPCNRASIINDGGTNVLNFTFNPSDINTTTPIYGLIFTWPGCGDVCTTNGPWLPFETYNEITFKLSSGSYSQATLNPIILTFDHSIPDNTPQCGGPCPGWMDYIYESHPPYVNNAAAGFNDYSGGAIGQAGGVFWDTTGIYDQTTAYITYGFLITSDGSATIGWCLYQNGTLIVPATGNNCVTVNPLHPTVELAEHYARFPVVIGSWNQDSTNFTSPVSISIKSMRVFTCSGYKGNAGLQMCPGTVIH